MINQTLVCKDGFRHSITKGIYAKRHLDGVAKKNELFGVCFCIIIKSQDYLCCSMSAQALNKMVHRESKTYGKRYSVGSKAIFESR